MAEKVMANELMKAETTANVDKPKIIFWRRWEKEFKEPRTGTLKYALLNRKETGFHRCVRIINKRIYLDVAATFEFFNSCKEV